MAKSYHPPATVVIDARRTAFGSKRDELKRIIGALEEAGFVPLIHQAKQRFVEVFGESDQAKLSVDGDPMMRNLYSEFRLMTRLRHRSRVGRQAGGLLAGDLFFSQTGNGILYLGLMVPEASLRTRRLEESYLEAGYVGDEKGRECLDSFLSATSGALQEVDVSPDWRPSAPDCPQFEELARSEDTEFLRGTELSDEDLARASHLESPSRRSFARVVKRSGGVLESDLIRQADGGTAEAQQQIEELVEAGLVEEQYVVICRKTSNQINRVKSKAAIAQMSELQVLCSCGAPIADERVEVLFSPTQSLQRMLDHSYWMTARLVQVLTDLDVPRDRILLDLREGPEEVDAFVDLCGSLLMFELKDNEFSMGHAYPFAGRIGLYKPDLAVIVCTNGVAPDVKAYFEAVKPEAQLVYVGQLDQLPSTIGDLARRIRSERAYLILSMFDQMALVATPLSRILVQRIGLEAPPTE